MSDKPDLFPHDNALERLPAAERNQKMEEKLHKLVSYAYEKAPGFKKRMDKAGFTPADIKKIDDLQKLSVLRKDDLIKLQKEDPPFGGYLAVPLSDVDHVYQSPARSTIHRGRHGLPLGPDFGKGQIVMNTWSYHITPAGLLVDNMLRGMGFTVFPAGIGNTDLQVQVMHDLKATGFVGTPSFLATLIKKAEDMGYDFKKDFNLKFAMVSGEMGGEPLRKMFTEKYGIICLGGDAYATADIGSIASSCEKDKGMHVNTDVIVEIVDPASGKVLPPGEIGEIVVTPFDEVYPLVRFGTGDLGMLVVEPCECGRTTPRIPKIMGRSGDAVRVRAMFVHPKQTDEVISKHSEIANYQLIVTRIDNRDNMLLEVELASEPKDKTAWAKALEKDFAGVCKVRFDKVEYVKAGTIAKGARKIVDKRTY